MKKGLVWIVVLGVLVISSFAVNGPITFHTEKVVSTILDNGSTTTTGTGFLDIQVPNTFDVLQFIRINMSGIGNTNLLNSVAYRNVAASPTINSTTRLLVDTVAGTKELFYVINNSNFLPALTLSATVNNTRGGKDLFSNDNIATPINELVVVINITNPSVLSLTDVDLEIRVNNNTFGGLDALNITTATPGASVTDIDSDGFFDTISFLSNFTAGQSKLIIFNATSEELVNFVGTSVNLNGFTATVGARVTNSRNSSYSGVSIVSEFARSGVKSGIDLLFTPNTWKVRGLFNNLASSIAPIKLTYLVNNYSLYKVDSSTGTPDAVPNLTFSGTPPAFVVTPGGANEFTPFFNTGANATKPYYTARFDWEVMFDNESGGTGVFSNSSTTLELPNLLMIDEDTSQTVVDGSLFPTQNSSFTKRDFVKHVGNSNLTVPFIQINSIVPFNSTAGNTFTPWVIFDPKVTYKLANGTEIPLNITSSGISVTIAQPTAFSNGLVQLNITDLSSVSKLSGGIVGNDLLVNELIRLDYNVSTGGDVDAGEEFNFSGNATLKTQSGTPITENLPSIVLLALLKRLTGFKDIIIPSATNPTMVNVTIRIDVSDKSVGQDGITGIKLTDFVPNGTDFNKVTTPITFKFRNSTSQSVLNFTKDVEYNLTAKGIFTLSDGLPVFSFEYADNASELTWDGSLFDGGFIEINYLMNITTEGVYTLPAQIAAFDPSTGRDMGTTAIAAISIFLPESYLPFAITEGESRLASKVVVGKPPIWTKAFDVYNPNSRQTLATFKTKIFDDSLDASVFYYDDVGQRVEEVPDFDILEDGKYIFWQSLLQPLESRQYEVRITTPPVLEIDTDIEVLEKIDDKMVKLKQVVYLKNFGEQTYKNVLMPVPLDNILSVTDEVGKELAFDVGEGSAFITIPSMGPNGLKTVVIVYKSSFPKIIVSSDKNRYNSNSPVGLSILVINGGETLRHPLIDTEVFTSDYDTIHSNFIDLDKLQPLEKTETFERFVIPMNSPTGTYIAQVRFRENFATIAEGTGKFFVYGVRKTRLYLLQTLLIVAAGVTLLYLSYRRAGAIKDQKEE